MTKFSIRPYQAGDGDSINAGFNRVFGLQRSLDEWQWKFQPAQNGSHIMLAVDEQQRVAAHFAALRVRLQVNGRQLIAGHSVDDYCLRQPAAVAQKIYLKTARAFYEAFGDAVTLPFLLGFPGKRHMRLGQLQLQFGEPLTVPVWRRQATRRRCWWRHYTVKRQVPTSAADTLWSQVAARYPVSPMRDAMWLQTRYLSRPQHRYIPLSVWRDDVMHAWAIAQVTGTVGQWVELVWDGQDARTLVELEDALSSILFKDGAQSLEMWLSGDALAANVLARQGWVCGEHPEQLQMTTRAFAHEFAGLSFLQQFYLTMGDSDLA